MLRIDTLITDAKCYEAVRQLRWPEGIKCPWCQSDNVRKRGLHQRQRDRQRYHCNDCDSDFDDLTNTIFAHHHQPLRKWVLCLYLMGLNLSNEQIAEELDLDKDDVFHMATQLRSGVVDLKPTPELEGTVECDEVYIVAGHKGQPEAVKKRRKGRRRRLKGERGRGTLEKEKPPVLGLIQRNGEVVIKLLPNVQRETIKPVITKRFCPARKS